MSLSPLAQNLWLSHVFQFFPIIFPFFPMDFRGEPLHGQVKDGEFKEVRRIPHPSADVLKAGGNKVKAVLPVESGGCVYKVRMDGGWGWGWDEG